MPGIVGSGWAKPFAGSPDEAPGIFFDAEDSCKFKVGVALAADEARRRRCDPVVTRVVDGEARLLTPTHVGQEIFTACGFPRFNGGNNCSGGDAIQVADEIE